MLQVEGIDRFFGDHKVLDNVSFGVERGKLTGFVGGNGAGKTTTMRIILGVLSAHAGTVTMDGQPLDGGGRRSFGYMPEERGLYPKMKIAEQIGYLARLHGYDRDGANTRARDLLERLGLGERADDPLEALSLGNQQRVQIAAALVHNPDVLILDEPFSGLDPMAVEVVLGVLTEYAERGVPVLFSSHQLDVVERLSDRLVIIAGGKIRADGTAEDLREAFGVRRHRIVTARDAGWVRDVPGARVLELDGATALFEGGDQVAQQVLTRAIATDTVLSFGPVHPSLSEIFKDVVTDEESKEQAA
ncbi:MULTISPECIES: ABC transporter ATP-binding protein [unclassified Pseudactinotalea]|uniref:ABC transporter ATP-binding protein n=1 Tax=unclassified Pseudactinotalea TaxID=2649176 RepID=UPI003C7ED404